MSITPIKYLKLNLFVFQVFIDITNNRLQITAHDDKKMRKYIGKKIYFEFSNTLFEGVYFYKKSGNSVIEYITNISNFENFKSIAVDGDLIDVYDTFEVTEENELITYQDIVDKFVAENGKYEINNRIITESFFDNSKLGLLSTFDKTKLNSVPLLIKSNRILLSSENYLFLGSLKVDFDSEFPSANFFNIILQNIETNEILDASISFLDSVIDIDYNVPKILKFIVNHCSIEIENQLEFKISYIENELNEKLAKIEVKISSETFIGNRDYNLWFGLPKFDSLIDLDNGIAEDIIFTTNNGSETFIVNKFLTSTDNISRIIKNTAVDLSTPEIVVSLTNGKSFGRWTNGQTIPAYPNFVDFIKAACIEDIYPTYSNPSVLIIDTLPDIGEVGETISDSLTAVFYQNDAGNLVEMRILKDGIVINSGTTSPLTYNNTITRINGTINYKISCDYLKNTIDYKGNGNANDFGRKLLQPSGTPDPRNFAIRSTNNPQAAGTNFESPNINVTGYFKRFYGPCSAIPEGADPAARRIEALSLPHNELINIGNTFTLATGTELTKFIVLLPPGKTITSVTDISNLNIDLTNNYVFIGVYSMNDAGTNGTEIARDYNMYLYSIGSPYPDSANHVIVTN